MASDSVVLDTNTVLDVWFFNDVRLGALRRAIEEGRLELLSREDCLQELRCVLAYPQFAAKQEVSREILEGYSRRVRLVPPPAENAEPLPRCRDRHDQKFLEVARDGNARFLVTRDNALLGLADHRLVAPRFQVLTPARFSAQL